MEKSNAGNAPNTTDPNEVKLLKITLPNGVEQIVPHNPQMVNYHNKKKRLCNPEKSAKYLIETIAMPQSEALKIGFGVPSMAVAAKVNPLDMMAEMMKQNQELMKQLVETKTKTK